MPYKTQTRKGYNGWEATSEAVIGETDSGTRILKLRTARTRGGISSAASVCERQNRDGAFYAEVTAIFGDFYKSNIAPVACNRVTEKAVIAAHTDALPHMDDLIAQAKAFYAPQNDKIAA